MYQLPNFNIVVGVRHATAANVWDAPVAMAAQLRGINKFFAAQGSPGPLGASAQYLLAVPAGADVRDAPSFAYTDLVEVDGFSGPLVVVLVWDVAFGFDNEHRMVALQRSVPETPGAFIRLPGQGLTPYPG